MSPFLFLLCAEGLTSLLKFYGGDHIDGGIRVSFRAPWVNHLLFADDCLVFISATTDSADRLNRILQIYASCSGQAVNRDKSAIFFSPNTPTNRREAVKQVLTILVETFSERYLGLPTAFGRITSDTFEHI
uniref:Reverse transcriptase domain-containing protein n=1 Tax=Triticum urartu TaxID=4572 RepID=A0A8R7VBA0_TRIUA